MNTANRINNPNNITAGAVVDHTSTVAALNPHYPQHRDRSATSSQKEVMAENNTAGPAALSNVGGISQQAISNNPDVLKNILSTKAAPVVVPRQNDGMYHGVKSQGLDRAINYINYEQS